MVLVNGFDAWVHTLSATFPISSQRYQPDVIHPDGMTRLIDFQVEPWPRWTYQIGEDLFVEQDFFVPQGASVSVLRWSLRGNGPASLMVRPFLSGRDFHGTHHENGALNSSAEVAEDRVTWNPYPGVLRVTARSNGRYTPQPNWYDSPTAKNRPVGWISWRIWQHRESSNLILGTRPCRVGPRSRRTRSRLLSECGRVSPPGTDPSHGVPFHVAQGRRRLSCAAGDRKDTHYRVSVVWRLGA